MVRKNERTLIPDILVNFRRYCTVPPICGKNVLKEERQCGRNSQGGRRRRRKRRKRGRNNDQGNKCFIQSGWRGKGKGRSKKGFHIVKRKQLSKRTRGMLKYNRAFYTRWSKWSACSEDCKATRTK